MKYDSYRLEWPEFWVDFPAQNDLDACNFSTNYIKNNGLSIFKKADFHLYRFPKEYVNKRTNGLIEVVFL